MKKQRIIAIVETLLIGLLIFSAVNIGSILANYHRGDKIYDTSEEKYFKDKASDSSKTSGSNTDEKDFTVDLDSLKKQNPDIFGWIYIKGAVSYPLLQCDNNEKYLTIAYNNKTSNFGSIFLDFRCNKNLEDKNTIIYGHNMKNGSMFGPLKRYKNADFFNEHQNIYIITSDHTFKYKIFAAYTTTDSGSAYTLNFKDDTTYLTYLKTCKANSVVKTETDFESFDKIITLSTCTSESENGRFVVQARLVEFS